MARLTAFEERSIAHRRRRPQARQGSLGSLAVTAKPPVAPLGDRGLGEGVLRLRRGATGATPPLKNLPANPLP